MNKSRNFTLMGITGAILSIAVLFAALFAQPTKQTESAATRTTQSTVEQEHTPETSTISPRQNTSTEADATDAGDLSSQNWLSDYAKSVYQRCSQYPEYKTHENKTTAAGLEVTAHPELFGVEIGAYDQNADAHAQMWSCLIEQSDLTNDYNTYISFVGTLYEKAKTRELTISEWNQNGSPAVFSRILDGTTLFDSCVRIKQDDPDEFTMHCFIAEEKNLEQLASNKTMQKTGNSIYYPAESNLPEWAQKLTGNTTADKNSSESTNPQKFNGDRRYSVGTYCRKDGKCVYIKGNDDNQAMTLDVSELGKGNPLPAKQDTIPLAFYMQGPVAANTMSDQFNMLTSYTYTTDCTYLQDCMDGEIRRPDFSTTPFQNIGSAMEFVEPPIFITKVMSTNTTPVVGEDASNPPKSGSNYIYFWENYNHQYASDDSVFYEQ